jgi:hypothetical protein
MRRRRIGEGGFLALSLAAVLSGAAPARAAVALQSGASGTTQSWRPEEGATLAGGHGRIWWTAGGEAWLLSPDGSWSPSPGMDLPVPVRDVHLLSDCVLLTVGGDVWHVREEGWARADRFPG